MINIENFNYEFPLITISYLLAVTFIGFIIEYVISEKNRKAGNRWGFFLLPIGLIAVGFLPNENPIKCYMFNGVIQNADAIKKYKELLDMGAITQEEFETKKKELLKEHS